MVESHWLVLLTLVALALDNLGLDITSLRQKGTPSLVVLAITRPFRVQHEWSHLSLTCCLALSKMVASFSDLIFIQEDFLV